MSMVTLALVYMHEQIKSQRYKNKHFVIKLEYMANAINGVDCGG